MSRLVEVYASREVQGRVRCEAGLGGSDATCMAIPAWPDVANAPLSRIACMQQPRHTTAWGNVKGERRAL